MKKHLKTIGQVMGVIIFTIFLMIQESQIFSIKKNGGNELMTINQKLAQVETHIDNIYDILLTVCVDKKD